MSESDVPSISLLCNDLAQTLSQCIRKGRQSRLHAHLDGLERTQGKICQELRTSTCSQEYHRLVRIRECLLTILVFEDFVESVFTTSLATIPNQGRRPTEEDTPDAFSTIDLRPAIEVRGVELGIDLTPSLD